MSEVLEHLPCARWARDVGVDPAGTAPQFDVLVLVEHPLPWPRDVGDDPVLAQVARVAAENAGPGRTVRVQAAACNPERKDRRVVAFDRGRHAFDGYGRAEGFAGASELAPLVAELLRGPIQEPSGRGVTDVLICTHGARDRCCGSAGTRLWAEAEQRLRGVQVWRTSHTGGHRFAPTALTFPDGGCWAYCDDDVLFGLVDRTLAVDAAAGHLRGCTAFEPSVQVADRAVLAARGWDWFLFSRFGHQVGENQVELGFTSPSGERGIYEVVLERGRVVPVPDCGFDPAAASKSQVELKVARIQLRS